MKKRRGRRKDKSVEEGRGKTSNIVRRYYLRKGNGV